MTDLTDRLILRIEAKFKNLDKIDKLNKKFEAANVTMNKAGRLIDAQTKKFISQETFLRRVRKAQDAQTKSLKDMQSSMLGAGLSLLFTGMAIKNLSQNIIRGLGNAFMTLADEGSVGVKRILEIQAATQFLKFVLFDTFVSSDLFGSMVEGLVTVVAWISELIQTHPKLVQLVGVFLVTGVILGGIAMILGQMALLATGLGIGLGSLVGVIFLVASAIAILFFIWTSEMDTVSKIILTIGALFVGMIAMTSIFGTKLGWIGKIFTWLSKNPIVWLILAIVFLINMLVNLTNYVGGARNAFLLFAAGVIKIAIMIGRELVNFIINPLNQILLIAGKIGTAFGADWGKSLTDTANSFRFADKYAGQLMAKVDKGFGIDKIRAQSTLSTDPVTALKQSIGGRIMPDEAGGTGESQLAAMRTGVSGITAAKEADVSRLSEINDKANTLLESMKTEGININDNGITRLSDALGAKISEETVIALFNNLPIMPSTEQ